MGPLFTRFLPTPSHLRETLSRPDTLRKNGTLTHDLPYWSGKTETQRCRGTNQRRSPRHYCLPVNVLSKLLSNSEINVDTPAPDPDSVSVGRPSSPTATIFTQEDLWAGCHERDLQGRTEVLNHPPRPHLHEPSLILESFMKELPTFRLTFKTSVSHVPQGECSQTVYRLRVVYKQFPDLRRSDGFRSVSGPRKKHPWGSLILLSVLWTRTQNPEEDESVQDPTRRYLNPRPTRRLLRRPRGEDRRWT